MRLCQRRGQHPLAQTLHSDRLDMIRWMRDVGSMAAWRSLVWTAGVLLGTSACTAGRSENDVDRIDKAQLGFCGESESPAEKAKAEAAAFLSARFSQSRRVRNQMKRVSESIDALERSEIDLYRMEERFDRRRFDANYRNQAQEALSCYASQLYGNADKSGMELVGEDIASVTRVWLGGDPLRRFLSGGAFFSSVDPVEQRTVSAEEKEDAIYSFLNDTQSLTSRLLMWLCPETVFWNFRW